MDILITWFDAETKKEKAKIYHNIDKDSIAILGRTLHFAHPGCWQSGFSNNRYCIDLIDIMFMTTDPKEIKDYADEHENCINRGLYVSELAS